MDSFHPLSRDMGWDCPWCGEKWSPATGECPICAPGFDWHADDVKGCLFLYAYVKREK